MPYNFSDANGHLSHGPTIGGLRVIKQLMSEYKDWPRPALEELIEHGHTTKLPALSVECRNLANKTNNKDIKSSLTLIASLSRKAEEILMLTD